MSDYLLFAVAPYVAVVSLVLVTLLRLSLLREREASSVSDTLEASTLDSSSQVSGGASERRGPRLSLGRRPARTLFQFRRRRTPGEWALAAGMLGVLAGHGLLLVFPDAVLALNRDTARLLTLEASMFLFGVMTAIGLVLAARVRLRAAAARATVVTLADVAFAGVLLVVTVSGLVMAARYRWASSWSVITLTPYVHSLVRLDPQLQLIATPYLVKLHVFSSIALVALLPFSSAIDVLLALGSRAIDLVLAPVKAGGRRRGRQVQTWFDERGRRLVWPEDEE